MRARFLGLGFAAFGFATATSSLAGKGTIDAASIKITVYQFAVSTSADCTHPITVFTSAAGVESDLLSDPTYGSGHIDAGTYQCVMIELSKVIKTSAASTSGQCTQGAEFSDVICQDGQGTQSADGTTATCSGGAANAQHVTLFITTASAGTSGDRSLLPPTSPTDSTSGLRLTSPLIVSGDAPVTLVVDPTGFLDGSGPVCGTSAPSFSVR